MTARERTVSRLYLNTETFAQAMRERGWKSNDQAATALGVNPSVLSKLRARKITQPSGLTIDAIVTGTGLPYTALFRRVEAES